MTTLYVKRVTVHKNEWGQDLVILDTSLPSATKESDAPAPALVYADDGEAYARKHFPEDMIVLSDDPVHKHGKAAS